MRPQERYISCKLHCPLCAASPTLTGTSVLLTSNVLHLLFTMLSVSRLSTVRPSTDSLSYHMLVQLRIPGPCQLRHDIHGTVRCFPPVLSIHAHTGARFAASPPSSSRASSSTCRTSTAVSIVYVRRAPTWQLRSRALSTLRRSSAL